MDSPSQPPPPTHPARGRLARLALVAASFLIALLGAELVLRIPAFHPAEACGFTARAVSPFYDHQSLPGVGWTLAPSGRLIFCYDGERKPWFDTNGCVTMTVNEAGYRGPVVPIERTPRRPRIVALGDSFTYGYGVPDGAPWPDRLAEDLAAHDIPADVLNFGVPGYDTPQEVTILSAAALPYHPDLVVVGFFLNDATGTNTQPFLSKKAPDALGRVSVVWRLATSTIGGYLRTRRLIEEYRVGFGDQSKFWQTDLRSLDELSDLSRREGFRVLVAIFPVLFRLDAGYPFKAHHAKVEAACRERGFDVVDLLPAFLGHDGRALWVHACDQHPNPEAHKIAAKAIAEEIVKQQWFVQTEAAPAR